MNKKIFAFGALAISLVIGLQCMVSSISAFSSASLPYSNAEPIVYGVFYLLAALGLLAASLLGIVFVVIGLIKNKDNKLPSILAIVCAGILILVYDILSAIGNISSIVAYARNLSNEPGSYATFYGMEIFTSLCSLFTALAISFIVAALAILSFLNFKKKSKEQPKEEPSELDELQ